MASVTTLAYDSFTGADGTDIIAHKADQSFGSWAGFAGLASIISNKYAGAVALSNYNHSGNTLPVDNVTYVGELTRINSTAADNGGGLRFMIRSNGNNKGATHSSVYLQMFGNATANTALIRTGRQAGSSQADVSTLTTMSWVTNQTYRFGVFVSGSSWSVWHEDSNGSNHVDYAPISWVTEAYAANEKFSIDVDLSASDKTWYLDNLAIYDSYYTGLLSQSGGGGGSATTTGVAPFTAAFLGASLFTTTPLTARGL